MYTSSMHARMYILAEGVVTERNDCFNATAILCTYTTHNRVSGHQHIYINIHQTCGKAIIGMAPRVIKTNHTDNVQQNMKIHSTPAEYIMYTVLTNTFSIQNT